MELTLESLLSIKTRTNLKIDDRSIKSANILHIFPLLL
jgi:hypothetical protein